jgi:hypothetical protein
MPQPKMDHLLEHWGLMDNESINETF